MADPIPIPGTAGFSVEDMGPASDSGSADTPPSRKPLTDDPVFDVQNSKLPDESNKGWSLLNKKLGPSRRPLRPGDPLNSPPATENSFSRRLAQMWGGKHATKSKGKNQVSVDQTATSGPKNVTKNPPNEPYSSSDPSSSDGLMMAGSSRGGRKKGKEAENRSRPAKDELTRFPKYPDTDEAQETSSPEIYGTPDTHPTLFPSPGEPLTSAKPAETWHQRIKRYASPSSKVYHQATTSWRPSSLNKSTERNRKQQQQTPQAVDERNREQQRQTSPAVNELTRLLDTDANQSGAQDGTIVNPVKDTSQEAHGNRLNSLCQGCKNLIRRLGSKIRKRSTK